ncbi:uncharacterized protein BDW70DRAFT_169814 [Aspergillus foveolatus]|uniref:uncharacterized protein n=1 Tax=Aspergillus foveolatus TaxID=210207 RepID=UPI003CCE172E
MASLTLDDYTIAWICALPLEAAAARAMLDKTHTPPQQINDSNAYEFGELNGHHIVIAHLPGGVYGTVSAAAVAESRARIMTFVGDVVVSKPGKNHSGVIQYDYGKAVQNGEFEQTGTLNKPPHILLMHMSQLEAKQISEGGDALSMIVWEVLERSPNMEQRFSPPSHDSDLLFHSSYRHVDMEADCGGCDKEHLVKRSLRDIWTPYVHYDLIASGDQHGILCFEMEAAGIMDELPTLVIRGLCDNCDSHKQEQWRGYAALTAAPYAKLLLSIVPVYPTAFGLAKGPKARHWMVPLARNAKFVGRQDEITELKKLLAMQDGPRRVAITGLGGVGKTQVALELAYRKRDKDQDCSVYWLQCTSHAMIVGLSDERPEEIREQIKLYFSMERSGKWLLIFDNADDAEMWLQPNNTRPALEDSLPQSESGRILFTTRNRELAVDLTFSNIISIPDEDRQIAWSILENLLLQKHLLEDHGTIVALLDKLAYPPLAIAQAAAYINKKRISLSIYIALLQKEEQTAVELLSESFRDPGRYKGIENPVITTDYLFFMACINPRNIPQSLLPSQASEKKRFDALGLLNAYCFTNSQDTRISTHRLNGLFIHWTQRVADQLMKVFPNGHYTNRGLWREYLPHALALVQEEGFSIQQEQHINLVGKIAHCLYNDGRYMEAEAVYKKLLEPSKERNGPQHHDTLTSMANIASINRNQGRWDEAEKLGIQVMETRKTVLRPEHPSTLASIANVASTYRYQGRWDESEKLGIQVMKKRKTVLGAEHPDTLASMVDLAYTWKSQGRLLEALALLKESCLLSHKILGSDHPRTRDAANALDHWQDKQDLILNERLPPPPPQIENRSIWNS